MPWVMLACLQYCLLNCAVLSPAGPGVVVGSPMVGYRGGLSGHMMPPGTTPPLPLGEGALTETPPNAPLLAQGSFAGQPQKAAAGAGALMFKNNRQPCFPHIPGVSPQQAAAVGQVGCCAFYYLEQTCQLG
jgi:hypothetical protein